MNTFRSATISLLLGVLGNSPVLAVSTNSEGNPQWLGLNDSSDSLNTDVWELVCAGETSKAKVRVTDVAGSNNKDAKMSVHVVEVAALAMGAFKTAPSEGATSQWAEAATEEGVYTVTFSKSDSGDDSYRGEALCDGGTVDSFKRTQNH